MTFLGLQGGGGALSALLHPLDLLINVIATPICGLIQMLPFELQFKCHKGCNAQTRFTGLIVNRYDLGQTHIFVICVCPVKGVVSVVGHAIQVFWGISWYMNGWSCGKIGQRFLWFLVGW